MPARLVFRKQTGETFASELASWDLLGFIYGKYFVNIERYYGKQ
jgi:hypothetical protein